MEREILFRGKRLDNDAWVYGAIICQDDRCFINPQTDGTVYCSSMSGRWIFGDYLEVDPATVGQFTGLTDKNGKKIFEGDIVATPKYGIDNGKGQNYSGKDKFAVGYSDGTYTLENGRRRFCLRPDVDAVVCGNIYDNPELLV